MSLLSILLVVIILVHLVIAFVASTTVLSIPSRFLKFQTVYVAFSLAIPFFGLLVIIKNGVFLPKLHQAYSDLNAHVSKGKQGDTHYSHDAASSDSFDGGDGE